MQYVLEAECLLQFSLEWKVLMDMETLAGIAMNLVCSPCLVVFSSLMAFDFFEQPIMC